MQIEVEALRIFAGRMGSITRECLDPEDAVAASASLLDLTLFEEAVQDQAHACGQYVITKAQQMLAEAEKLLVADLQFLCFHPGVIDATRELATHWMDRTDTPLDYLDMEKCSSAKCREGLWTSCVLQLHCMGVMEHVLKSVRSEWTPEELTAAATTPQALQTLDDAGWACVGEGFRLYSSLLNWNFCMLYYSQKQDAGAPGRHDVFLEKAASSGITFVSLLEYLAVQKQVYS
jgi:hypothetical protein